MEILSSGSFINLDNEEKIEQLVFTAQEIAEMAAKNKDYVANEENNKKLVLNIWQGAEYMCRDIEEVQIKNIFIGNFLDRMSEISGVSETLENQLKTSESESETNLPDDDSKDEYLGLVQMAEVQEQEIAESEIDRPESAEKPETIRIEMTETTSETEIEDDEIVETAESSSVETEILNNAEIEQNDSTETIQVETTQNSTEPKSDGSIVLPDKEPYQFDKCTITATIQLLPTDVDTIKVVLSVRTHDFPPQNSVHELSGEVTPENLLPELEQAFERYKGDLPVKVMDKLRKEKDGGKKKKRERSTQLKLSEPSQTNTVNNKNVSETEEKPGETAERRVVVTQVETNPQGSLFGS